MIAGTKGKRGKCAVEKKENRRRRLDKAFKQGLQDTFPASDPVAVTDPAGGWRKQRPPMPASKTEMVPDRFK
jgi:hypothetical protein